MEFAAMDYTLITVLFRPLLVLFLLSTHIGKSSVSHIRNFLQNLKYEIDSFYTLVFF